MRREKYSTVLDAIAEEKDWPLLTMLTAPGAPGINDEERWKMIHRVFLAACARHDDKAAVRYFRLTMQALKDCCLAPAIRSDGVIYYLEQGEVLRAAEEAVEKSQAVWSMELWQELPKFRRGNHRVPYAMDVATLLEIRAEVLSTIAKRWRDTRDEQEADKLFDFLITETKSRFPEETKVLLGLLRETTNAIFPVVRLTRHYLLCANRPGVNEEIANILAIARTRNSPDVFAEFALVRHLEGCSQVGRRFIEEFAAKAGSLDRDAISLWDTVQSSHERSYFGKRIMCGEVSWRFSVDDLNAIIMTITLAVRREFDDLQGFGESQFELAKTRALKWKEGHPDRKVILYYNINSADSAKDWLFARSCTL